MWTFWRDKICSTFVLFIVFLWGNLIGCWEILCAVFHLNFDRKKGIVYFSDKIHMRVPHYWGSSRNLTLMCLFMITLGWGLLEAIPLCFHDQLEIVSPSEAPSSEVSPRPPPVCSGFQHCTLSLQKLNNVQCWKWGFKILPPRRFLKPFAFSGRWRI